MGQEKAEATASAGKGNGERQTVAAQGSMHTPLHFFSFLSQLILISANHVHFLSAQKMANTINMTYNTNCSVLRKGKTSLTSSLSSTICTSTMSNSSSVDAPCHIILLILNLHF